MRVSLRTAAKVMLVCVKIVVAKNDNHVHDFGCTLLCDNGEQQTYDCEKRCSADSLCSYRPLQINVDASTRLYQSFTCKGERILIFRCQTVRRHLYEFTTLILF